MGGSSLQETVSETRLEVPRLDCANGAVQTPYVPRVRRQRSESYL